MDEALQRAVLRKVAWRLLPFLFALYVVNILDRVNVGFAKLQMVPDLHLSKEVFPLAAGIFYIGYVLFEVPSNLLLRRTGARRWIARIMVSWGLVTCAMLAVRGPWSFYLLRILLGFAEAGFFPGIILYLTYWFPARQRARAVAFFMVASPVTGVLGNPVSGAIMEYLNGVGGLRGWQWLFLLEGAPAIFLGLVVLRYLTDRPEQAAWLPPRERTWLAAHLAQEEHDRRRHHGLSLAQALMDGRVWLLILLYLAPAVASNGIGFYLPTLLEQRFPDQGKFRLGLLAAVPNGCAAVAMILNGMHSDRTGERRWHVAVPAFVAAAGCAWAAAVTSPALSLLALTLIQVGVMSMLPVFWALPTSFLSGAAAAGGIALINSLGNLGGFVGPNLLGRLESAGSFAPGLLAIEGVLAAGGLLALCVRAGHPPPFLLATPADRG
jgi:ACS family tartrate transporter-like MFS transporter